METGNYIILLLISFLFNCVIYNSLALNNK